MWFTESSDSLLMKTISLVSDVSRWAICCKKDWFFMFKIEPPLSKVTLNVNCLGPRMLCAKFGWNCLSAFRWQWILFHTFGAYSKGIYIQFPFLAFIHSDPIGSTNRRSYPIVKHRGVKWKAGPQQLASLVKAV